MKFLKVNSRQVLTNYKHEQRIEYMDNYVNFSLVQNVFIFGDVARISFNANDYIEIDMKEWEEIKDKL